MLVILRRDEPLLVQITEKPKVGSRVVVGIAVNIVLINMAHANRPVPTRVGKVVEAEVVTEGANCDWWRCMVSEMRKGVVVPRGIVMEHQVTPGEPELARKLYSVRMGHRHCSKLLV